MRIENAELYFLELPFRLSVTHGARAGRTFSDSIVLRLTSGKHQCHGEAVVRDYVSGSLGMGEGFQSEVARITSALLAPLRDRDLSWQEAQSHLRALACDASSFPLLCAVESALLACASEEAASDPYTVLGMEPQRTTVTFGGTLPMFPIEMARKLVQIFAGMGMPDLKVKVGSDLVYNDAILSSCRQALGDRCDIRVDANAAWTVSDVESQMRICARYGVRVIEQPFPVAADQMPPSTVAAPEMPRNTVAADQMPPSTVAAATAKLMEAGFLVMVDEGVLTSLDVRSLASSGLAQMLNLRLSKNGGLSRVLALAREAEACGLSYQLGCMVGETGILSSLGRLAASLLPRPAYLEGGYDDVLLQQNITIPSFGFGPGGKAPIVRKRGIGYQVDEAALLKFTRARLPV